MNADSIVKTMMDRPRLQVTLVKMLPLNLILLLGSFVAPWDFDLQGTSDIVAFTLAILAMVCMLGWSIMCIYEDHPRAAHDVLTFVLFMLAIGGMRHGSPTGLFVGYATLFTVGVLWMSLFSSPRVFAFSSVISASFLFGPVIAWPERYTAEVSGLVLVYVVSMILAWAMLLIMRLMRTQMAASTHARLLHDAILEGASECYVCVDENLIVTEYNTSAELVFGRPAHEVIGAPLELILTVAPSMPTTSARPGASRNSQIVEGIRADGTRFPLQCFTARVEMGEHTLHPLFMHDVSTRERRDAIRSAQHAITAMLAQGPKAGRAMDASLNLIGTQLGLDGLLLLRRSGDSYLTASMWSSFPMDDERAASLRACSAPLDDPYWDKVQHQGTALTAVDDLPAAICKKALTPAQLDVNEVATTITPDGQFVLLGWRADEGLSSDELARADYLSALQLLTGLVAQYLARRSAESKLQTVQAMELNDDVVQALSISFIYRRQGQDAQADEYAARALQAAKRFITRLAMHSDGTPGSLVREQTSEE